MRLFFAVPLDRSVRETVWAAVRRAPVFDAPWRWIEPENYHLTLKFLGEIPQRLVGELGEAGREASAGQPPFVIRFGRAGVFPHPARPRVVFYEIEEGLQPLAALAERLEQACEALGIERERRPFRAHLTLARIRCPLPAEVREALLQMPPLPEATVQTVACFVLLRSRLDPRGAEYEEIDAYPLPG